MEGVCVTNRLSVVYENLSLIHVVCYAYVALQLAWDVEPLMASPDLRLL